MLRIGIPHWSAQESAYIIRTLFDLAGITQAYELNLHDSAETLFDFGGKMVSFPQVFFQNDISPEHWYTIERIPEKVTQLHTPWSRIPVTIIYGTASEEISRDRLDVGLDIVASAFFMLTRWEESIKPDRDVHGRFPGEASLAVKSGFIQRPVVNEYAFYLRKCLEWLGLEPAPLPKGMVTMSFDIDQVYKFKGFRNILGSLRRNWMNPENFFLELREYLHGYDPYDKVDFILACLEKTDHKAIFFFKAENHHSRYDKSDYLPSEPKIKAWLTQMESAGHLIGLHPSYASFESESMVLKEKAMLEQQLSQALTLHRKHFLRIAIPESYRELRNVGFEEDHSLMYTHFPGYRNGSCSRVEFFDTKERKTTGLWLVSLMSMMFEDKQGSLPQIESEMLGLASICLEYGGNACLLWHNSDLDTPEKMVAFERLISGLQHLNHSIS